jgi:prolyl 4-hydroxylase
MQRHPQLAQAIALSQAGRTAEAILIINRLAAENEPGALATLAEMKWRGGMVPQDPVAGRDLFRRAGERGHVVAGAFYTNLLASGVAGERDWPQAMKRLRDEAKLGPRRRDTFALVERMKLTPDGDPSSVPEGEEVSASPDVRLFPRLFTSAECDYLLSSAEGDYQPSFVHDSTGQLVRDTIRTSDGSTLHWMVEDPAVHALNRRLAAVSGTGYDQGEALQILRYRPGQQYRSHLDFVRTDENVRIKTALVYLNEGYEGGETFFVKAGFKLKGRKGDAVVFRNALSDRRPDPMSEHAGLPVTKGVKYLGSRWIRERRCIP